MREIRYIKKQPTGGECGEVEDFFRLARNQFIDSSGVDGNIFALEIQPNDGTRYHMYVVRASGGHIGIVAMDVPRFMVVEVNLDDEGDLVFPFDNPLSFMKSPFTAAIFADVVSAVLRGTEQRFYDYEAKRPGPIGMPEEERMLLTEDMIGRRYRQAEGEMEIVTKACETHFMGLVKEATSKEECLEIQRRCPCIVTKAFISDHIRQRWPE